jgi:hypothetical protein
MITGRTMMQLRALTLTVLFALLSLLPTEAQAQKNIITVWCDTVLVDQGQSDIFVDVKYKLKVQRPPIDFNGYSAHIGYIPDKVNIVSVHLQNTASRHFPDPIFNNAKPGEARLVVFGAQVDTANRVLFRLRVNVKPTLQPGEATPFGCQYLDISPFTGIDSIELVPGAIKRRVSDPKPVFDSVIVTLPDAAVLDTTSFAIPVSFNDITGSVARHIALSFDYDSALVTFDSAKLDPSVTLVTLAASAEPTHVDIFLQSVDTTRIKGGPDVFTLFFTSKQRMDTSCTMLSSISVQVLNDGAKVDFDSVRVPTFCVNGTYVEPEDTLSVVLPKDDLRVDVLPNPVTDRLRISVHGTSGVLKASLVDVMGREVTSTEGIGAIDWSLGHLPRGAYYLRVETDRDLKTIPVVLK